DCKLQIKRFKTRLVCEAGLFSSGLWKLQIAQQIDHFNCAKSTVIAFVAGFGTGSLNRLLDILCGENPEKHGDAAGEGDLGNSFGDFITYIVVMGGASADDGSQADDGVVISAVGHF